MRKMLGTSAAMLAIVAGSFVGATSAQATPHVNEGVCPEYEAKPNKVELSGEQTSVTVTAPEGMKIVGYCVKAGSANQGLGPHEVSGLDLTTLVITYPSVPPKAISHYTLDYEPLVSSPDDDNEPVQPELPTFIVDWPTKPTVCKGVVSGLESTEQVYYAQDSVNIYVIAQEGFLFAQDLVDLENGIDYIVWPISSLDEVCPPETVVVDPPAEDTPATDPVTPVVEANPVSDVPAAPDATSVVAEQSVVPQVQKGVTPQSVPESVPLANVGAQASTSLPRTLANTGTTEDERKILFALGGIAAVFLAGGSLLILWNRRYFA